jgi:myo-inositol catabolism protein IolC
VTVYVPNPDFADEWAASDQAVELAASYAKAALPIAIGLVAKLTEDLANSLEAVAGVVEGQATGRVLAKDFKGHWLEFGTGRPGGRAQPYLRPAMEAATGAPVVGGRA